MEYNITQIRNFKKEVRMNTLKEVEKIIENTRRCPNCNHGIPEECCIEYFELKRKLKELKDKK